MPAVFLFLFEQKMRHMKSKDNLKTALYDYLDWLEAERSQHIMDFWRCVFKDIILEEYPTLKRLRDSLMDGQSLALHSCSILFHSVNCFCYILADTSVERN